MAVLEKGELPCRRRLRVSGFRKTLRPDAYRLIPVALTHFRLTLSANCFREGMMEAWRGTGDPRVASPIIYKAQRGLALRHRTGGYAGCELPRISIPRTWVNKGRTAGPCGGACQAPKDVAGVSSSRHVSLIVVHSPVNSPAESHCVRTA